MPKFDIDVTIKELAPYVGKVDFYNQPTCYMGYYDNKPVFKLSENVIHILDFSDTNSFHKETQSIKKAIKLIIASVNALKQNMVQQKIKNISKDFE